MGNQVNRIKEWFEKCSQNSFGIELPSGWIGRPYDNCHELKNFQISKNKVLINFDNHSSIVVTGFKEVTISSDAKNIEFKNFTKLKFSNNGKLEQFNSGSLVLHGYFSSSW